MNGSSLSRCLRIEFEKKMRFVLIEPAAICALFLFVQGKEIDFGWELWNTSGASLLDNIIVDRFTFPLS